MVVVGKTESNPIAISLPSPSLSIFPWASRWFERRSFIFLERNSTNFKILGKFTPKLRPPLCAMQLVTNVSGLFTIVLGESLSEPFCPPLHRLFTLASLFPGRFSFLRGWFFRSLQQGHPPRRSPNVGFDLGRGKEGRKLITRCWLGFQQGGREWRGMRRPRCPSPEDER